MAFSSFISKKEVIFDDETPESEYEPEIEGQGRGLNLEMRGPGDYEYGEYASPFPDSLLVPESDWEEIIKEMEQTKSRTSDICTQAGLRSKNQAQTNYCWVNSPVYIMEVQQVVNNGPPVTLSPASAGARIKNFQNRGGWGREAVEFISVNGVNTAQEWSPNAIDRRLLTNSNIEVAKTRRVVEWIELKPRSMVQLMSMLLRRIPVTVGLNWWRHQVSYIDPIWKDGAPAYRFRNTWGDEYGDNGYGIVQGAKMLPDDAVAMVSKVPFLK